MVVEGGGCLRRIKEGVELEIRVEAVAVDLCTVVVVDIITTILIITIMVIIKVECIICIMAIIKVDF